MFLTVAGFVFAATTDERLPLTEILPYFTVAETAK